MCSHAVGEDVVILVSSQPLLHSLRRIHAAVATVRNVGKGGDCHAC